MDTKLLGGQILKRGRRHMIEDQQERITNRVSIGLSFLFHNSLTLVSLHDYSITDHYHTVSTVGL